MSGHIPGQLTLVMEKSSKVRKFVCGLISEQAGVTVQTGGIFRRTGRTEPKQQLPPPLVTADDTTAMARSDSFR
jgi:hypothetical protein